MKIVWPDFQFPPINLWIMPKLSMSNKEINMTKSKPTFRSINKKFFQQIKNNR